MLPREIRIVSVAVGVTALVGVDLELRLRPACIGPGLPPLRMALRRYDSPSPWRIPAVPANFIKSFGKSTSSCQLHLLPPQLR